MPINPDQQGTRVRTGPLNPDAEKQAWEKYFGYLIKSLHDPDVNTRLQSARMLGENRDPRAIESLASALHDPDARVRLQVTMALGRIGGPAVAHLVEALHDPDEKVRQEAAKALGHVSDPEVVAPLVQLLRDSRDNMRQQAAFLLGKIGSPAVNALLEALKDDDPLMRWNAVRILGHIGDFRALEALDSLARTDQSALLGTGPLGSGTQSVAEAARQAADKIRKGGSLHGMRIGG